ncbi:unnamed protein product [Camellia sinensis]
MGWKAAQKLIHYWKILRGDNVKKHIKQGQGYEGGIFTVEAPLHVSNVQVLDPVTGRPCKVGIRYLEDGAKARVSRGIGTSGQQTRDTALPSCNGQTDTQHYPEIDDQTDRITQQQERMQCLENLNRSDSSSRAYAVPNTCSVEEKIIDGEWKK